MTDVDNTSNLPSDDDGNRYTDGFPNWWLDQELDRAYIGNGLRSVLDELARQANRARAAMWADAIEVEVVAREVEP